VDIYAPDPMVRMLAVGDTLALPIRLLGQAASEEILVSPEVGRLVEGWVALETRALQLRSGSSTRVGGYAVVGVHPGRAPLAPGHSGLDPEVEVPALLHLLGMPVDAPWFTGLGPEARRAQAFATLQQMILASSQQQPLVLALENLHWIDPTSEAFLTLLVESL